MTVQYDPNWVKALDLAIENLCQPEPSNVKIVGDYIIVVAPPSVDVAMVYIGTFDLVGWAFKPSRAWVYSSVKKAGITRLISWIEHNELRYNFSARQWIAEKLGIQEKESNCLLWTVGLMLEYAEADCLLWTVSLMLEYAETDLL